MSRNRYLVGLLAVVALAGCEMEATVKVVDDGRAPRFDITYDRGKTACVKGLTVTDVTSQTRRDVWAVRQVDALNKPLCTGTVKFGVVPPGYEVAVRGGVLAPGRRYEVSASGVGWHANAPVQVR